MRDLINTLNEATKAYDEGHPIMTDKEWDDLYFQLKEMEKDYGIVYPDSPTNTISYEIVSKLNKVEHNHPMLSLDKTKEIKDVIDFIDDQDILIMLKMDGLTCSLTYNDGILVSAETRGNGHQGEDITHNARVIPSIPSQIPYKGKLVVDGEIICKCDDFKTFEEKYENPRNFAAGSIRLLSAKECGLRKLTFVAWDVIEGLEGNSLYNSLVQLDDFGFEVVPNILIVSSNREWEYSEQILTEIIEDCKESAAKVFYYPIDGIVFKYNDIAYGKSLGATTHHFKNAIAYKFYDETYETELINIEWTMGRTGVLTPVAVFKPIDIDGSTVERASLHNVSIMIETLHGYGWKGQKVEVFKANMIIPQIASAELDDDRCKYYFGRVMECPVCGHEVILKNDNGTTFAVCSNDTCEGKLINRIDHFCGKKGLDIKGLSIATIEKLIDWGWLESISDIFNLHKYEDEWIKKPGFGPKSVRNILTVIEESKHTELWKFISALGIPLIGSTYAKEMCKREASWFNIREDIAHCYDFSNWEGFGPEMSRALNSFNYAEADYLADNILNLYNSLYVKNCSAVCSNFTLSGMKIVITGKLNKFKNRDELKIFIERSGGKVVGSISKSTNMLVNNDINSESSKNIAAKKLGIPIISEEEFINQYL